MPVLPAKQLSEIQNANFRKSLRYCERQANPRRRKALPQMSGLLRELRVIEERHKAEVHVQLLMAVKECQTGVVG